MGGVQQRNSNLRTDEQFDTLKSAQSDHKLFESVPNLDAINDQFDNPIQIKKKSKKLNDVFENKTINSPKDTKS